MSIATQLKAAIDRSISHNEIVHITIDGTIAEAMQAIREVFDGATDYSTADDCIDVWGWTKETQENEQDWRLSIRFA